MFLLGIYKSYSGHPIPELERGRDDQGRAGGHPTSKHRHWIQTA